MAKTALLLSGGFDSTCVALLTKPSLAYFVDYGQLPSGGERRAARDIASRLNIELVELAIDLKPFGMGIMAGGSENQVSASPEWWPYRNQAIITIAAMDGVRRGVEELIIGTVHSDGSRHADGKPEFLALMDKMLRLQEGHLRISAPALSMTPKELVQRSGASERLLLRTFSCHSGNFHCGNCPGCKKRAEYFGW